MNQIIDQLKISKNILVASHSYPDGDAIASLLAMGEILDLLGKKITLFNESIIPVVYKFLPNINRIVKSLGTFNEHDLAIILDCGDLSRVGNCASQISKIPVIINIDHHITNTYFGNLHIVDKTACATAEIVYRIMKFISAQINKQMAIAIYTGILTDTGSFRFSNTNQAAFQICEEMIKIGIEPYHVAQHVYGKYSLGRIKLLNLALDSIEVSKNGWLSIMTITQKMLNKTDAHPEDIDGFINYAKRIEDVKVAVLIHEQSVTKPKSGNLSKFQVSLRSNGLIDVSLIASSFGGGGHYNAAGFFIETTLADLKDRLFAIAEKL